MARPTKDTNIDAIIDKSKKVKIIADDYFQDPEIILEKGVTTLIDEKKAKELVAMYNTPKRERFKIVGDESSPLKAVKAKENPRKEVHKHDKELRKEAKKKGLTVAELKNAKKLEDKVNKAK